MHRTVAHSAGAAVHGSSVECLKSSVVSCSEGTGEVGDTL